MLDFIDRHARRLEEAPGSALSYGATFVAIVMTRHLLEILAGQNPVYFPFQFYIHYTLAYVAPFLALILVLHAFARTPIVRVARLMLHVWALTLLPPLVDLLLGRGGEAIGYLRPGHRGVGETFLRFLDPTASFAGTTPGIRVETAVACLLGAAYVYLRGRRHRSGPVLLAACVGAAAGVYVTALGFFTLPRLFEAAALRLAGWDIAHLYLLPVFLRLPEPVPLAVIDRLYTLYLIPLCLLLAAACAWRAGRTQDDTTPLHLPGPAGLAAGVMVVFGLLLGGATRRLLEPDLGPLAPVDLLAAAALILAGVLIPAAARLLAARRPAPVAGAVLALAAAILAHCSGASTGALLLVALFLGLVRRLPPLALDRLQPAGALAAGVAGLALFGAGMTWALGQEALMLTPHAMAVSLVAGLAAAALAAMPPRPEAAPGLLLTIQDRAPFVLLPAGLFSVALGFATAPAATLAGLGAVGAALLPRLLGRRRPTLESVAWVLALALVGGASLAQENTTTALATETTSRAKFLIGRGMEAEDAQRYEEAAALYRRSLQRDPDRAAAHARLGEILWQHLDDPAAAKKQFRQALALDPDDLASLTQLAALLGQDGRIDEALDLLRHALDVAPNKPSLWWEYAGTLALLPAAQDEEVAALESYLECSAGQEAESGFRTRARHRLRQLATAGADGSPPRKD
ncbi:MAG: tetratricopeptide repeat protein [Acidobacteria bacterium]|nr:tetratricopeptide repeat protein [Acidobacteriota bacterium]